MRILGAGDLHGDIRKAKQLSDKAVKEKVDLIILCGDLMDDDSIDNILQPFKDRNQKVLFVAGNHESLATADFLSYINKAKHLHGYSYVIGDVGVFGCGAANVGIHGIPEQEIFDTLKKGNSWIKDMKKRIMVTHVHPSYTNMEKLSKFVHGSTGITKAIYELQPDILLCSHVHEAEGLEEKMHKTKIINVGTTGKIIDI